MTSHVKPNEKWQSRKLEETKFTWTPGYAQLEGTCPIRVPFVVAPMMLAPGGVVI